MNSDSSNISLKMNTTNVTKHRLIDASITSFTFYYIAFACYLIQYILATTTMSAQVPRLVLMGVAIVFLAIKLLYQRYSHGQILVCMVGLILAVISLLVTNISNLTFLILFVMASEGISIKRLALIALIIQAILFVIVVSCAYFGFIDIVYQTRTDGTVRSSMGFSHPNRFGLILTSICLSAAILRFPKFRLVDLFLYIPAAIVVYVVADSRTSVILICAIPILLFICSRVYGKRGQSVFLCCLFIIFCIILIVSIYCMVNYSSAVPWMAALNDFVSSRFSLAHSYYEMFPLQAFGRDYTVLDFQISRYTTLVVDNMYAYVLIQYGIIPGVLIFIAFGWAFLRAIRRNDLNAAIFGMFLCAVLGIAEAQGIDFPIAYCLIGCAPLFFGWKVDLGHSNINIQSENRSGSDVNEQMKYIPNMKDPIIHAGIIEIDDNPKNA